MATALCELQLTPEAGLARRKLDGAAVFVLGATGAAAAALVYLARAGVGTLGFADGEELQAEDLAGDVLHEPQDVGRYRALSARDHLRRIAPNCRLRLFLGTLTAGHAARVLAGYQVVLDTGEDEVASETAAAYCREHGIPLLRREVACAEEPVGGTEAATFGSIAAAVAGAWAAGAALRLLLGESAAGAGQVVDLEAPTGRLTCARRGGG